MTRWFKLSRSTSYQWRSKITGRNYSFSGSDQLVPVDDPRDQARFLAMRDRLVEVDQKGSVIDQKTGQTIPAAFSRHGMVPPRSYAKIAKTAPAKAQSPRPEPAPRTVVSSKKASAPPAPVALAETALPAQPAPKVTAEKVHTQLEEDDASMSADNSADASPDSEPMTRTKKSSKKSGRKGDE